MSNVTKINDFSDWVDEAQERALAPTTNFGVNMIRVSTKKQKSEAHYSDKEQREVNDKYIQAKGIEVVREWDIAETASKHDKRYNFNAMLDYVRESQETARAIKHIVFSHQSRCARNRKSARMIEELVEDFGVVVHFARENRKFDRNADIGELIQWVLENERNTKHIVDHTKNVKGGMKQKLEKGGYCGQAPYGYINFSPSPKAESVFKFDGERADYMRAAFDMCASGLYKSVQQLSLALDNRFSHLDRRPRMKRLYTILRNPFYYGGFRWKGKVYEGSKDYHEPLVSRDVWNRVQKVLDGRARSKVTTKEFHYLKMLKCGGKILDERGYETDQACGYSITAEEKRKPMKDGTKKSYFHYRCSRNKTDGRCSQRDTEYMRGVERTVSYAEDEIATLFEAVFRPFNWTPELVKRMQEILRAEHAQKSGDHRQQVASLRRRYEMLQTYMDKAYDDKLAGDLTPNEWREKNERWKREREETKAKIDALDAMKDEYIENGVLLIGLAQRAETSYKIATPAQKRNLVEIVSSDQVLRNGTIQFVYRKPFDLLAATTSEEKWWSHQESNLEQFFRKEPLYPFNYGTPNGPISP